MALLSHWAYETHVAVAVLLLFRSRELDNLPRAMQNEDIIYQITGFHFKFTPSFHAIA